MRSRVHGVPCANAKAESPHFVFADAERKGDGIVDITLSRWSLPPGDLTATHIFHRNNRSVAFQTHSVDNTLNRWSYTRRSGLPRAGGEDPRIDLWLFQGSAPQNGLPVELIVGSFEFVRWSIRVAGPRPGLQWASVFLASPAHLASRNLPATGKL